MSRLRLATALLVLHVVIGVGVISAGPTDQAMASTTQVSIIQDDPSMMYNAGPTLARLRLLGVQQVRVLVRWLFIAPNSGSYKRPAHFNAVDPASYPAKNWQQWDNMVKAAQANGIQLIFDVAGGAPLWATGPGATGHSNWEPNTSQYGQFVHALGTRYSGAYNPIKKKTMPGNANDLPKVSSWSIWNEPDYGPSLAPQGLPGNLTVDHAPAMYRGLVSAGWNALHVTGHGHDTIMFGELAPRGEKYWGVYSGMTPLVFLRSLYCLDAGYRQLRGTAARLRGCPTNAAGSRAFRNQNPGLFQASGISDHPYMRWYPPNHEQNPDPANHLSTGNYASLGVINQLSRALDRAQAVYGAHPRMPVYNTEFGYITTPPKHDNQLEPGGHRYPWASQAKASEYLNWAEYLSYRNPRIKSFEQYLLYDALPALKSNDWGGFASGLINYGPKQIPKSTYYAWRFPLYLPVTSSRRGRSLEVWGCLRPARYAILDGSAPQTVSIQYATGSGHPFKTVATATVNNPNNCYFDSRVTFPGSGNVRLQWQYPANDPLLGPFTASQGTITSRTVQISLK
jgi:hypothetical protein